VAWKVQQRLLENDFQDDPMLTGVFVQCILLHGKDVSLKDWLDKIEETTNGINNHFCTITTRTRSRPCVLTSRSTPRMATRIECPRCPPPLRPLHQDYMGMRQWASCIHYICCMIYILWWSVMVGSEVGPWRRHNWESSKSIVFPLCSLNPAGKSKPSGAKGNPKL